MMGVRTFQHVAGIHPQVRCAASTTAVTLCATSCGSIIQLPPSPFSGISRNINVGISGNINVGSVYLEAAGNPENVASKMVHMTLPAKVRQSHTTQGTTVTDIIRIKQESVWKTTMEWTCSYISLL
ncbi:hypothetical protein IV203_035813 [Nitzschia inconspicua]|uniref:Uncharacterized protein n=1 Tax=Nitzschia inconspicua TaxID=303405 RepID=A0A9K3LFC2_9STRA|nr:hypothetical protein IV203_035813 [Nitzschia inconspicua]